MAQLLSNRRREELTLFLLLLLGITGGELFIRFFSLQVYRGKSVHEVVKAGKRRRVGARRGRPRREEREVGEICRDLHGRLASLAPGERERTLFLGPGTANRAALVTSVTGRIKKASKGEGEGGKSNARFDRCKIEIVSNPIRVSFPPLPSVLVPPACLRSFFSPSPSPSFPLFFYPRRISRNA